MTAEPVKSVLPSWRFAFTNEMMAESKRFFQRVESMPLYETPERMAKLAASFARDLPTDYPLIAKVDQKCGGVVTEAILHLGRTYWNTRQPGYFYQLGRAFESLPLQDIEVTVQRRMRAFVDYVPAKRPQTKSHLTY